LKSPDRSDPKTSWNPELQWTRLPSIQSENDSFASENLKPFPVEEQDDDPKEPAVVGGTPFFFSTAC
jgi:hypothetical protein